MTLDSILGQVVPVSILKRGLENRSLGHAYLFSGERGLGKETTARAVAKELMRLGGPLSELHVLSGEKTIKIDEIRELRQNASLATSGHSVWIIVDAERMPVQSSNAFLKILEEPPPGAFFFLTATKVQSLLPTIVSRCQLLPFRRISERQIGEWLAQRTGQSADDPKIRSIAKLAQGSIGRASEYWEGSLLQARADVLDKLVKIPTASYPEVLGLSQNWPEDRFSIVSELQLILEWHRDLLTVKNRIDLPLYNPGYEDDLTRISSYYSERDLYRIIDHILTTERAVAGNARIRFYLGYLFLLMKKGALT